MEMEEEMEEIDLRLLSLVQEGFPLTPRPFRDLGEVLGLGEREVIERLDALQERGLVRRIGPILDMRRLGRSGILAALKVSRDEADELAEIVNQYQEISHNYLRPNESGYNMWFTVSATEERIQEVLAEIRRSTGRRMLVLPTGRIFKIGVKFDIMDEEEE
ncbi:MAG TPA: AsnC family transcriptional regulator [Methanothrix sp.]|jgi:DNA-binding Lrp family transcriptional regulator|nr:AsnC family transcriptional regulator [Methanothrix sp.]MDI9417122.1 AsnC family transcriptional regulator [Euryarchaeota archaeon]HON35955.1 AsnC family transcriptional regulator [Methanothrix sp.]HRU75263.1 AsnC family transcriptional regulator [Methanothrix sp.]